MSKNERRIRDQIIFAVLVLGGVAVALSLVFIRAEDLAAADLFDLFKILFGSVVGIFALIVLVLAGFFLIHRYQEISKEARKALK